MSSSKIFTQLCALLPLSPSLWFNSPPPCVNILYTRIQCEMGGKGIWGSEDQTEITPVAKFLYRSVF
jgi:hypothetical protein